jgi:hypothetical protein
MEQQQTMLVGTPLFQIVEALALVGLQIHCAWFSYTPYSTFFGCVLK